MDTDRYSEDTTMTDFFVEIVDSETQEVVKRMGPMNERNAGRVEEGVGINLNHEKFYTRVIGGEE